MGNAGVDGVAIFGFLSGFMTVVLIGYRRQLRTRLPVIAVGLLCCGVYGFLAGVWPLGFCLIALAVAELRRDRARPIVWVHRREIAPADCDGRITRMFGRA